MLDGSQMHKKIKKLFKKSMGVVEINGVLIVEEVHRKGCYTVIANGGLIPEIKVGQTVGLKTALSLASKYFKLKP